MHLLGNQVNLCIDNPCGDHSEECIDNGNTMECTCYAGFTGQLHIVQQDLFIYVYTHLQACNI